MDSHLILRPFGGEDEFDRLATILTTSENADCLPVTITALDLAERLRNTPRLDLNRDLVIAEADGVPVGFGFVRWWDEPSRRCYGLEGHILPPRRRQGIGRVLLAWLEARAGAISGEHPASTPGYLRVNTTQYQPGLRALVQQAGYGIKESWVLMVRPDLDDIPDLPLPDGLEVRPALPEHLSAIWHAVEEAYEPEGGPPPTGVFPEDFKQHPNFQPELWQVAWEITSGKVVGSVLSYIDHAENKQLGILRGFTEGISTVPRWQRRGVASALIARSLNVLREAGMTESALICSGENLNNLRLYASCGFQEVKRDTVYEKGL